MTSQTTDTSTDQSHPPSGRTAVAVLGMGAMGSRVAAKIADDGHDVSVWNRSPDAARTLSQTVPVAVGATVADTVREADVVLSMVADDNASRRLWLDPDHGAMAALPESAVAIEASTITRAMALELDHQAKARGIAFLEAPVVGSRPQAEAGALVTLAGGDAETVERVRPIIEAYSAAVRPVGAVGNAATMKLAINGLFGIQVAAYAEIVGLLDRSDVDTDAAIEVLAHLPITSPGLQRILGLFAQRDFTPNFPVALVAKDFAYLEALAGDLNADIPVAATAGAVYQEGAGYGQGGNGPQAQLDIAGIATRYLRN